MTAPPAESDPRRVALDTLIRIDAEGAYANVLLPKVLDRTSLDARDRAFVTELVYGTTRMQRACDWLVDRFVMRELDPPVRAALRLGTYQLHFMETPAHAAVGATVEVVPKKVRGFVNAVLRRIAGAAPGWPNDAVRLSYPDWLVDRLTTDLGPAAAIGALEAMNERAGTAERADGYVQDPASQWVAEMVEVGPGHRVADLCAAPGGKSTALAAAGASVFASDVVPARVRLLTGNIARFDVRGLVQLVAGDGTRPPYRPRSFDRVLVDAPCSGLGALRRRADARWRVDQDSIDRLAVLQRSLVDAAETLLVDGGMLVYSVCTLTAAESVGVDEHVARVHPDLEPVPIPGAPWIPLGRGALLLPQAAGTDGMALFRYRR